MLVLIGMLALTLAVAVLQAAFDILASPLVIALLAVLALGLDSYISALLIRGAAKGVKPQQVVYGVSGVFVAIAMLMSGSFVLPSLQLEPPQLLAAWGVITAAWAEATKLLYELLLKRWWKTPDVPVVTTTSRPL